MTIKKTAVLTSIILASGLSLSATAQAEGQPKGMAEKPTIVDGDAVTIDCIPQAEVDALTDAEKEKLKLPVCEDVKSSEEKNAQGTEGKAPAQ